uniref:Protection of telomeres protein 1a n=1 Tax=Anthurium amnicola TaxID=1678845 RepID=A0A1D1XEA0_9ARAE
MTNREEGYLYLPLADARKVIHVRANLFVAVVEIGAASRSKGTDYFLKLRIADPSYIAPGMSVNFFSGDTERLPRVKSSRDIICLRRVMMKIYNEEVYCAFHKKFSSFALFEGKSGSSFSPYQSSQNFHCVEHDVDCIKQLRTWLLDHQYAADMKDYSLQLREIKVGLEFDLICKVVHVCEIHEDAWMLFIWDGTDAPPIAFETKNYNERIVSDSQRRPLFCFPRPSFITETDYDHEVDATLMDSLTYPEVTHKCKCIVRVVAACPWRAENLYSLMQGQFRVRLTLEDPTARVHAYICGEDGMNFFGGHPSVEELDRKMNKLLGITGSVSIEEGSCSPRDPPWVHCCLKSYYVDKSSPWQNRRYRIFGTRLVG